MDSDIVRKVTFTGSIPVGQHLMRRAADTVKRMSMELGGHAPVIIHEDVDPVKAAIAAATGKSRNNGQVCVSPTRFYVHKKHEQGRSPRISSVPCRRCGSATASTPTPRSAR